MEKHRTYVVIDLKSFYASVECRERYLDPLTTKLVVANLNRTEKTICLAVSPSLKSYGISGRARLFEVAQRVKEVNTRRLQRAPGHVFRESFIHDPTVRHDPSVKLDYLVAPPQMERYIEVSTQIYGIYLHYVAPEDIHVYSIDEVFIDATDYLTTIVDASLKKTENEKDKELLENCILKKAHKSNNFKIISKIIIEIGVNIW